MNGTLRLAENILSAALQEMGAEQFFVALSNSLEVIDWIPDEDAIKIINLVNTILEIVKDN
jgi:hypothetical protein